MFHKFISNFISLFILLSSLHPIVSVLSDNMDECQICLNNFDDPVSLFCGHNFCRDCVSYILKKPAPKCRECKSAILLNMDRDLLRGEHVSYFLCFFFNFLGILMVDR